MIMLMNIWIFTINYLNKTCELMRYIILIFISIGIFYGCEDKNDTITLGKDILINKNDSLKLFTDTTLFAYTAKTDSFASVNFDINLFGSYKNDTFGATRSEIFTQIVPVIFDTTLIDTVYQNLDSVALHLRYDDVYGNASSPLKIKVYPLNANFSEEGYSNINPGNYYDPSKILNDSSKQFQVSKQDSLINISLNKEMIKELLLENYSGNQAYEDNNHFFNYFNGLYFSSTMEQTAGEGNIVAIDLLNNNTRLNLYYNDTVLGYEINSKCSRLNLHNHDYQDAIIEPCLKDTTNAYPNTYIQSMGGVETIIKIENDFPDDINVVLDAKLIIPVEDNYNNPFQRLTLRTENKEGIPTILPDDPYYTGSSDYINGYYNKNNMNYTFNITRYMQKIICEGKETGFCNHKLVNKLHVFPGFYDKNELHYNNRIMNHVTLKSAGIKIKIIYTN